MMKPISIWKQELADGVHTARLASLYCCAPEQTPAQAARYEAVLNGLEATFGTHAEAGLYSAPGRTEIGGNHTDHQHGRVLAGSVNIDMIAAAAPNSLNQLRVQSEGYDLCVIDLADLAARKEEENTTMSLLRGECEAFRQRGAALSGLDIYVASNVPKGSGVSSSAAFEVLIGVILNDCFMTKKVSPIEIAQIGQWAENVYFGKPCGLMDQMASSVGNIITIDFADPAHPDVEPVQVDFSKAGLALCILDSCADHADLTDEYAAVHTHGTLALQVMLGGRNGHAHFLMLFVPGGNHVLQVLPAAVAGSGDQLQEGVKVTAAQGSHLLGHAVVVGIEVEGA